MSTCYDIKRREMGASPGSYFSITGHGRAFCAYLLSFKLSYTGRSARASLDEIIEVLKLF